MHLCLSQLSRGIQLLLLLFQKLQSVYPTLGPDVLNSQGMSLFRRSSRSKRKLERKVGSGRKGTVDEEEYLLKSVVKLVDRFKITQGKSCFVGYFLLVPC